MIIPIIDGVRIASEPMNVTLEKRRITKEGPKAGTENWDVVGYYGDLRSCAFSLLTRHFDLLEGASGETIVDLKTLIDAVDFGSDLIARACETQRVLPSQEKSS